ncbi:ATP-binding protein [uncultured Paludibacter sp.]|nr:ATP-binding protein [uncultured Paludibacter sp.]
MIINFSVQNFGPIKTKQTLSFEATNNQELEEYYIIEPIKGIRLLKLALIYGANASGKSTLLQALDFLRDIIIKPLSKKTDLLEYEPFLFDSKSVQENTGFNIDFISNSNKRYSYEVELNKKAIIKEVLRSYNPNKAIVYERETDIQNQVTKIKIGSKIKLKMGAIPALETSTLWNNTVLGGFLKTNIEFNELRDVADWFRANLKPVINPMSNLYVYVSERIEKNIIVKENIIQFLQKADFMIEDWIVNSEEKDIDDKMIELLSKTTDISDDKLEKIKANKKIIGKSISFMHNINNDSYSLSYELESAGTRRYYQLSGILDLLIRRSNIFSIDEIDSSLHPDLFEHFIKTFLANSKKSQLIATTHYREFLMNRDLFRNDAIWLTEKQADGGTDLYSLADFDSTVIRNTSSVYNAYKIGKLGAKPNLGDYYINLNDDGKENN